MKRSRWLMLAAATLTMGMALSSACGFPDVGFSPEDGGIDGATDYDAELADTSSPDVSQPKDAGLDVALDANDDGAVDASLLDVAVIEDAGGKVDAQGCTTCDCDEDGYNRLEAGVDCGAGPYDCDDKDSRSHPDQLFLEEKAESPMNGDWNCSGTVEKGYPENVNCEGLLLGLGCAGKFGYKAPVACGEPGRWTRCKQVPVLFLPLACGDDPDTVEQAKIQPCK